MCEEEKLAKDTKKLKIKGPYNAKLWHIHKKNLQLTKKYLN